MLGSSIAGLIVSCVGIKPTFAKLPKTHDMEFLMHLLEKNKEMHLKFVDPKIPPRDDDLRFIVVKHPIYNSPYVVWIETDTGNSVNDICSVFKFDVILSNKKYRIETWKSTLKNNDIIHAIIMNIDDTLEILYVEKKLSIHASFFNISV